MKFDEYILDDIEQAVALGNKTNEQIAKALGIPFETFKNWIYETTKTAKLAQYGTRIKKAMANGAKKNRAKLLIHAENGLLRKLQPRQTEEITIEQWKEGKTVVKEHMVKKIKTLEPDSTLLIWTGVNLGAWISINKEIDNTSTDPRKDRADAIKLLTTHLQTDDNKGKTQ